MLFRSSSELHVHISHFIQLLLYALLGMLIFSTLNKLFIESDPIVLLTITLFFLCMPIHSEVVNSLKNRDEILSLLFSLLALRAAFQYADLNKLKYLVLVLVYICLALLSKKTALPMILIIPIALVIFRSWNWKKTSMILVSLLVGRFLYGLMKHGFIDGEKLREFSLIENPAFEYSFTQRIPLFFESLIWYFKQSIFPFSFSSYYGLGAFSVQADYTMTCILAILLIVLIATMALWGLWRKKMQEASFGLLFFFLSIAGACNLIFPMVGIVGERLVFTASLGIAIALVFVGKTAYSYNNTFHKLIPWLLGAYFIFAFTLNFQRNPDWNNRLSLYKKDAKTVKSAKLYALLGQELQYLVNAAWNKPDSIQGQDLYSNVLLAEQSYKNALLIYPSYPKIKNNLASLLSTYSCDDFSSIQLLKAEIKNKTKVLAAYENLLAAQLKLYTILKINERLLTAKTAGKNDVKSLNEFKNLASLGLLYQFETRGKLFLKDGLTPSSIQALVDYADGIESWDKKLDEMRPDFSDQIGRAHV